MLQKIHILLIAVSLLLVFNLMFNQNFLSPSSSSSPPEIGFFQKWHECVAERMMKIENAAEFWSKFHENSKNCDFVSNLDVLPVESFKNKDEVKYVLLPKQESSGTSENFITLGIGNDIIAEEKFQKRMAEIGRNVSFFGADPIIDLNQQIYSKIGQFFPFAVGSQAGYSKASVMINGKYLSKQVVYVDLIYFIDKILKIKVIDNFWLDAEGAEYGLFDIFYKNGILDQNQMFFCQMSLEVHNPNAQQKHEFMVFIKRLIVEKRFLFFKNQMVGHARLYLINIQNQYCLNKFIPANLF